MTTDQQRDYDERVAECQADHQCHRHVDQRNDPSVTSGDSTGSIATMAIPTETGE